MSKRIKLVVVGIFSLLVIFSGGVAFATKTFDNAAPTSQTKPVDPGFYVGKSESVIDPGFHVKVGNTAIDPHFYVTLNR